MLIIDANHHATHLLGDPFKMLSVRTLSISLCMVKPKESKFSSFKVWNF